MNRVASYIQFDMFKNVFVQHCADRRCRLHADREPMAVDLTRELIRIDICPKPDIIEAALVYTGRGAQYSAVLCTIQGITRAQHGYHQALPVREILPHALQVLPNLDNCPFDKGTPIILTLNGCEMMKLGEC